MNTPAGEELRAVDTGETALGDQLIVATTPYDDPDSLRLTVIAGGAVATARLSLGDAHALVDSLNYAIRAKRGLL